MPPALSPRSVCNRWLQNKTVNPRTNRAITSTGSVYKALRRECPSPRRATPQRRRTPSPVRQNSPVRRSPVQYRKSRGKVLMRDCTAPKRWVKGTRQAPGYCEEPMTPKRKSPPKKKSPTPRQSQERSRDKKNVLSPSKLSKSEILEQIALTCYEMSDPIAMEDFEDMELDELRNLIYIGEEQKKHCYTLDTMFYVIDTAVKEGKVPMDPINRDRPLSRAEIEQVYIKKRKEDPTFVPPKIKEKAQVGDAHLEFNPIGMTNVIRAEIVRGQGRRQQRIIISEFPEGVEPALSRSVDYTSANIYTLLIELWEQRKMLRNYDRAWDLNQNIQCCTFPIVRSGQIATISQFKRYIDQLRFALLM